MKIASKILDCDHGSVLVCHMLVAANHCCDGREIILIQMMADGLKGGVYTRREVPSP